MTATTVDRATTYREGIEQAFPVAAGEKIPAGVMVSAGTDGYAKNAEAAEGDKFLGVSMAAADNSSGADGAIMVLVRTQGIFEFYGAGLTQAMVGGDVFVGDNQTIAAQAEVGDKLKAGWLAKYYSATRGEVKITPGTVGTAGT